MIKLGLTGSIGMGKSATAQMFRDLGAPVYDADASVHALYAKGGAAVDLLDAAFPGVVVDGAVDRSILRERVVDDPEALKSLESIVHPLTGAAQIEFLKAAEEQNAKFIVLDVPLLYETGGDKRCDYVAVVSASASIQRDRVLARDGMTEAVFESILAKQTPDAEKRARADFIISTGFGFDFAREHVQAIANLMMRGGKDHDTKHT